MNRNLTKATIVGLSTLATFGSAMAQSDFPPGGWPQYCAIGVPNLKIYSDVYGGETDWNDLFGVYMGVVGQVTYGTHCYANNVTLDTRGRIGFFGGGVGSVQDTAYGGSEVDAWLGMTMGAYDGIAGNHGYAKTVRQEGTSAATRTLVGAAAIDTAYYGASDRYFVCETTNDNIRVHVRGDIMGDTCRLEWTLTNQGAQANIGLEFGQHVRFISGETGLLSESTFIDVPGYRPLITDHRFVKTPNLNATFPREYPMPPYANFGITQSLAYGLQVPTGPTTAIPDQTPVDILDIGKAGFLLGLETANDTPMPPYTSNGVILEDTLISSAGYVQRWFPTLVNQNDARVITAYYRTTWGVSDYDRPYSAVVDAPKVVAVNNGDPSVFNPNPMTIRVYVDNTRGFATAEKPIPLNDVRITLNLPQGMTDANNPSSNRIVKIIPVVPPVTAKDPQDPFNPEHIRVKFVDFQVNVDPNLYGIQTYSVTIQPNPGPTKTLTGSINVASQPRLLIRDTANLVTAPWSFSDTTWATILGNSSDPLVINRDFQAFEWDAAQQAYVLQTGPKRGFGNWIISSRDVGFTQLGGNPQTPPDLQAGAPLVVLRPGWNLIANPYNYSIPVSQLVGVAATDPRQSQTFSDLANQGIVSSTLGYWDQNTQSYKFTTSATDLLVPNRGYWLYVLSSDNVTLSYGPVFQAFIPQGTGGITSAGGGPVTRSVAMKPSGLATPSKWRLNLTVRSSSVVDDQNYIGVAKNVADVAGARVMKPPVAPTSGAVSASVVQKDGTRTSLLAQALLPDVSRNEWNWQVFTKSYGNATIAWPNMSQVPADIKLTLTDLSTNQSIDMRKQASYTFSGRAQSTRQFKIVATSGAVSSGPVLGSVSAARTSGSKNAPFAINYRLASDAATTVRILSGGKEVYVVTRNRQDAAGNRSVSWNLVDAANRRVRSGVYTVEVTATASGRSTEYKTTSIFVN